MMIAPAEVQSYFPENFQERFGLGENISFFGINENGGYKQSGVPVAKYKSIYITLLYDSALPHPKILEGCDMKNSETPRISEEGLWFSELQRRYGELRQMRPLIIIRLSSHLIKEDKDFIFAEFLRYADHEALRGKGIAAQIFESLCEKCRNDGLKYLYVNDQSKNGWPSKSKLIWRNWLEKDMLDEIHSTYYDKPRDEVFHVPYSRNMVRVLDDSEHERLYQQMLSKTK